MLDCECLDYRLIFAAAELKSNTFCLPETFVLICCLLWSFVVLYSGVGMVLAALLWVLRTLEPSGTPRATSVRRAAWVTACCSSFMEKKNVENPVDPPTLWNAFFFPSCSVIDPPTDMVNPEEPTLAHVLWGRPEFLKLVFIFYAGKNNNPPPQN